MTGNKGKKCVHFFSINTVHILIKFYYSIEKSIENRTIHF